MRALGGVAFSLFFFGCATHSPEAPVLPDRKAYIESELAPVELFLHTEQYLQWVLGYNVRVRDESRGLVVTDWVMDDPHLRHQLTIRVNEGAEQNSLLTANFVVQELRGGQWMELPSAGIPEEDFLMELEEQLRRIETERFQ